MNDTLTKPTNTKPTNEKPTDAKPTLRENFNDTTFPRKPTEVKPPKKDGK